MATSTVTPKDALPVTIQNGRYLNPALVIKYAKHAALANSIEKWVKYYREEILKAVAGGAICPKTTPYMLEIKDEERRQIAWKDVLVDYISRRQGAQAAAEFVKAVTEGTPATPIQKVLPKINPNYRPGA